MKRFLLASAILLIFPFSVHALTEDDIIDQVDVPSAITGAGDVQAEIESLVTGFVNDPNDYNGLGLQMNHTLGLLLYFRGRITSTLAPLIPLLPGTVGDTATLRGKLAARLKTEVQTYLLNSSFWDFQYAYDQPTQGANAWYTPWPNTVMSWNHRYRVGPHWENLYALWAYAYYTGDWTTIQNNLTFIMARYSEGDRTRADQRYLYSGLAGSQVYRDDPVHLALGLIGLTRILDHLNNAQEATVRAAAQTALDYLIDPAFVDRAAANGAAKIGWDITDTSIAYDYPPAENMTPELGRWLKDRQLATVTTRVNEAINSTPLKDRWMAGMFNTYSHSWPYYDESVWGLPNISFQLFAARAWVMDIPPATLRKEKPWPVIIGRVPKYRDMLYMGSLYALLSRHGTINWQIAEPN